MADPHSVRTKAFISYSHADEKYRIRLSTHLKHYMREENIDIWDDTQITPGTPWRDEIKAALASAKVAILLVSPDFLASEFIAHDELPPLLEASEKEGVLILPVILSPCAFQRSKLARYQAVNNPSAPLASMQSWQRDGIWMKLAAQVADALRAAPSKSELDMTPTPPTEPALSDAFISPPKQMISEPPRQSPRLEVENIRRISQLVGHEHGVTALAFSPNNQLLISGDAKGKVYIWDIVKKTSSMLKYPIPILSKLGSVFESNPITSIAFHPGGSSFFVGRWGGEIYLFQCPSGTYLLSIPSYFVSGVTALAISPDGLVLVQAGSAVKSEKGHPRSGPGVRARSSLAYHKYPNTDTLVDENDYPYVNEFKFHDCQEVTFSISFSPKGHFFAASGSTGTIRIWNISRRDEQLPLTNTTYTRDRFINVVFHPEEHLIAAINQEGQGIVWDRTTIRIQNTLDPISGKISAITFSPDGAYLAAAHSSGVIGFWNPASREPLFSFKAHDHSITALAYSPDGYHLVSGSEDRAIKVWGNLQN